VTGGGRLTGIDVADDDEGDVDLILGHFIEKKVKLEFNW
jgi:hypothetical protein